MQERVYRRKKRKAVGRDYGKVIRNLCLAVLCFSIIAIVVMFGKKVSDNYHLRQQNEALLAVIQESEEACIKSKTLQEMLYAGAGMVLEDDELSENYPSVEVVEPEVLPKYMQLYEANPDLIGWLFIEGTQIDYPVMQTLEDEEYYLYRDFEGNENQNGCLIMDTQSTPGIGDRLHHYGLGMKPCSNLIIHGHNMRSGMMFGELDLYQNQDYEKEHDIIHFDTLYEEREYEVIAVFYSQVYHQSDDVFKYYNFFQADTENDFLDFYENIKEMSLYDTGVTAEFGDEFLTLSTCAYQTENGRFVVVAKRIK